MGNIFSALFLMSRQKINSLNIIANEIGEKNVEISISKIPMKVKEETFIQYSYCGQSAKPVKSSYEIVT